MNTLVIGHTGFIGNKLFQSLRLKEMTVHGRSRYNGLDLTHLSLVKKQLNDINPDVIINCSAHVGNVHYGIENPAYIVHDNMSMILNLYKAISEVCPKTLVINPIANCSYPSNAEIQTEKEWRLGPPHSSALSYATSRRMIYVISLAYNQQFNVKTKNLIFPGVYGPGDHTDTERVHALDGIIIRMMMAKKSSKQKEFEIWGTGKPIREWCYIDDIVTLLIKTMEIDKDIIYPVNIGQKKGYSIRELAEICAKVMDYKGKLVYNTDYSDGAAIKLLDNKEFQKIFPGYVFTNLEDGIKNTIDYYQSIL